VTASRPIRFALTFVIIGLLFLFLAVR